MSQRQPITYKPYAVVFKWLDAAPEVFDVRETFSDLEEARAYLAKLKGKLPKGVEYAEIKEYK